MQDIGNANNMADILLDTSEIAILLFIVAECPFDKRSSVWIILVVARGLEISALKYSCLVVSMLGIFTLNAEYGLAMKLHSFPTRRSSDLSFWIERGI